MVYLRSQSAQTLEAFECALARQSPGVEVVTQPSMSLPTSTWTRAGSHPRTRNPPLAGVPAALRPGQLRDRKRRRPLSTRRYVAGARIHVSEKASIAVVIVRS